MSLTKEQILNAVAGMSVTDIVDLTAMLEKKFGISADNSLIADKPDVLESSIEEQTEFNVFLTAIGSNKIPVIKTVRSITGLGLKEAKELVESAPVLLKEAISKDDAATLKKSLETVGAVVEIK